MSLRDDLVAWANALRGETLVCANGLALTVTDAYWTTKAPLWLAVKAEADLAALGPNASWLTSDSDVGWATLLTQIGVPPGAQVTGTDKMIHTPTAIRAVLRLTTT